jgi:hypothetical protein
VQVPAFSPFLYRYRNLVERFFTKLALKLTECQRMTAGEVIVCPLRDLGRLSRTRPPYVPAVRTRKAASHANLLEVRDRPMAEG